MARNDVIKCPNCGFGTEKIDGCNHMTCAKCRYEWCWICRGKYYSGHFDDTNIFGCPGSQFSKSSNCVNIWKKIGILILLPFILALGPPIALIIGCSDCFGSRASCS